MAAILTLHDIAALDDDSRPLTVQQLARLLGASSQTIIRAIHRGELSAIRTSERGYYRITAPAARAFLARAVAVPRGLETRFNAFLKGLRIEPATFGL